MVFVCWLLTYL